MAKIALIMPNFVLRDRFGDVSDPPIGIAFIGGHLEHHGHEVLIVDAMAENIEHQEIVRRVADFRPEFVGISCNYSPLHNSTLTLASALRQAFDRSIFIFVGGNHATAMSHLLLAQSRGNIDSVIFGEGETGTLTLVEQLLAREPLGKIPGNVFISQGELVRTQPIPLVTDLDALGIPAYHLLPMDFYKRYNIVTMRGCPFSCSYCASTLIFTRRVRYRSAARVVDEIEYLLQTYGDRHFWFSDDTFTVNRSHTMALLQTMRERGVKPAWSCLTAVNRVKADLLETMRDNGCRYISYGIETGNTELLHYLGKKITAEIIKKASRSPTQWVSHTMGSSFSAFPEKRGRRFRYVPANP